MIGYPDNLRFFVDQLSIRKERKRFAAQRYDCCATENTETADCLTHRGGSADELYRNIDAFAAIRVADLLHRIAGGCRDRYRAQRRSGLELGWIDIDNVNRSAIESARQLQGRVTKSAESENRDRFTVCKSRLVQGMKRGG